VNKGRNPRCQGRHKDLWKKTDVKNTQARSEEKLEVGEKGEDRKQFTGNPGGYWHA